MNRFKSMVSIIMPVYNAGEFLRPSILSILNQSYKNIELILVDDGTTDSCIKINKDLISSDERINYIYQNNKGRPSALNRGLDVMRGSFWMIQDADDISYPDRIKKQVLTLIKDPSLAAVYCKNDIILPDGKIFAAGCMEIGPQECKVLIDRGRVPAHDATGMYRAEKVSSLRFDEEMSLVEGVDFVFRVGELFPIIVISDCLYSHRVNYLSITHARSDQIYNAKEKLISKIKTRRGGDRKSEIIIKNKKNSRILFLNTVYMIPSCPMR
ncbi:MAG: glycosyltransferase family 2 protein [Clostridia bacterium]|nr:glycosyltransferase family 2 protein [Clostridia bacterium]